MEKDVRIHCKVWDLSPILDVWDSSVGFIRPGDQ